MPTRLRLEVQRSLEISRVRLSPRIGCGQMLKNLPAFSDSEAMSDAMACYDYKRLFADKAARQALLNLALLRSFYDNAFASKVSLGQNFRQTYGQLDVYLALDPAVKSAWFVAETANRIALVNYFRDAVSLGLRRIGIHLTGSTVRLTPIGWQNLHDILTDDFLRGKPQMKSVEVVATFSGVRWRGQRLGLGVTLLNVNELAAIRNAVATATVGDEGEILT